MASCGLICPECGGDPRSGGVRPPWWAAWTGLPVVLALVMILGFALVGLREVRDVRTAVARSALEPWDAPSLRVGEVRAAAAGDDERAGAVAGYLLDQAHRDGMVFRTATLAVAPFRGEGHGVSQVRIGWPLHWLTFGRSTFYDDVSSGTRRSAAGAASASGDFHWLGWLPGFQYSFTSGDDGRTIECSLGALATIVLLLGMAVVLMRIRWLGRMFIGRRATLGLLVVLALVLLAMPTRQERTQVPWPRPGLPGLTLAEVTHLAGSDAGTRELAAQVAEHLEEVADEVLVQVFWQLPVAAREVVYIGWPVQWLAWGTMTPQGGASEGPSESRAMVLRDCIQLVRIGEGGQWFMSVNYPAVAAFLVPLMVLCASPRLWWFVVRSGRRRRAIADGRCLRCGYSARAGEPA